MSMAASIESRVPFLDHALVEFTASIPSKYSTKGMAGKCILKSAVAELLPEVIMGRKKMGFPTPWEYWLKGPQLEVLEQLLYGASNSASEVSSGRRFCSVFLPNTVLGLATMGIASGAC